MTKVSSVVLRTLKISATKHDRYPTNMQVQHQHVIENRNKNISDINIEAMNVKEQVERVCIDTSLEN